MSHRESPLQQKLANIEKQISALREQAHEAIISEQPNFLHTSLDHYFHDRFLIVYGDGSLSRDIGNIAYKQRAAAVRNCRWGQYVYDTQEGKILDAQGDVIKSGVPTR